MGGRVTYASQRYYFLRQYYPERLRELETVSHRLFWTL